MQKEKRKLHFWFIRLLGVLVPHRLRADWRQEWEAELQWREQQLAEWDKLNWQNKRELLWHSVGAFADALWLQPKRWEDDMMQDLRYAVRMLLKRPGFTFIAMLTLGLGIGVNTVLFTVYDAFLLKPLPLQDPGTIVHLTGYNREGQHTRLFSYQDYLEYRDQTTSFAGLVAVNKFAAPFGDDAADAASSSLLPSNFGFGRIVSGNYFTVLGAEMALGRGFAPEENQTPNTHPVLVLSHICWEQKFQSDPNIIGKTVRVAGMPFTVIGVTARGFIGTEPDTPQFWVPLMMRDQVVDGWHTGKWLHDRKLHVLGIVGRLKPGVTFAQAQAELTVIAEQLARTYPDPNRDTSVVVTSGATFIQLDERVKPLVAPLLIAVGLVLLIACVNVTNMLLARAAGRQREIAVRLALGAGRLRIVRQLLTESIVLAALGGAVGLLLAMWGIRLLYPLVLAQMPFPPALLEQFALDLSPDYRIFTFVLLLSLVAGVVAGLAPALQSSRPNLSGALKDEGSTFGAHLSQSRLRNTLVVMQIAVCLTLLIAAGLLIRNLQTMQTLSPGITTKNVFTLSVTAQGIAQEPNRQNEFERQLEARIRALPGVKSVAQAQQRQPLSGPNDTTPIIIAGQKLLASRPLQANYRFISHDFFPTLGLRITRGRGFTGQEQQANAPVLLVSESTARRFWPNEDPIGKRIGIGVKAQPSATATTGTAATSNFPQYEIIGLTNDTRQGLIFRPDETFLYLPIPTAQATETSNAGYLLISTEGDARPVMIAAHKEATALDPKMFVMMRLVEDWLSFQMMPFQALALLAGVLGALALLLASIGLYGVMSFVVSQRTREIGIRMALGAGAHEVIKLFLQQGGKLIAIGVTIGLAGGTAISMLLAVVLTDISQFDPLAFVSVAAFLTLIALSACYLPARRATKVDPMTALRHD